MRVASKLAALASVAVIASIVLGTGIAQATATVVLREAENEPLITTQTSGLYISLFEVSPSESFCEYFPSATDVNNSHAVDTLKVGYAMNCAPYATKFWGGTIASVKISVGSVTVHFSPRLQVAVPSIAGECRYQTRKLVGAFSLPTYLLTTPVTAVGARVTGSPHGCPKTQMIEGEIGVNLGKHPIWGEVG
jgi:hypothetical protein